MAIGDGLVSMKPSSVGYFGTVTGSTGATINNDGGVNWVEVDQLKLNGVFNSSFSNYLIVYNYQHSYATNVNHLYRLTSGGTADSSSTYSSQNLSAFGSSNLGVRVNTNYGWLGYSSPQQNGMQIHIYGPNLARTTDVRSITNCARLSSYTSMSDWSSTINSTTQYDGIIIYTNQSDSGTIHVFGYEE